MSRTHRCSPPIARRLTVHADELEVHPDLVPVDRCLADHEVRRVLDAVRSRGE